MFTFIKLFSLLFALCATATAAEPSSPQPSSTVRLPLALPQLAYELIDTPKDSKKAEATENLWQRLRAGFALPSSQHENIQAELNWYKQHPNYLKRVSKRAHPYLYAILNEVEARGLPSELALLPIVESAYDPFAYSHGRAAGLWQMIPGTAKRFGLEQNWWLDQRRDVIASTRAALDYLEYLHRYFNGDWLLALAAYNSGEGTVGRAVRKNRKQGKDTDFWSLKLPKETRSYLPKMLALKQIILQPEKFNTQLEAIKNQPFLDTVQIGSQMDLDLAAQLADISIEQIYRYNPAFNRWATPPKGPFELLIPSQNVEKFKLALTHYSSRKTHQLAAA
ncbi:MAG: transglycosylase SLT domain-containing protein [Gammaproteobacteria bacterium]|nr:transglycosylase SLT domain-containing protein [Gammaproteobacteria bacterium]